MNITIIPVLLVLQLLPFAVTLFALYKLIFQPMLAYLDEREESTGGAKEKAVALSKEAEEKAQALQDQLTEAKKSIGTRRANARAEATAQYNEVIDQARLEADATIQEASAKIQSNLSSTRAGINRTASDLANQVASQALGRKIIVG